MDNDEIFEVDFYTVHEQDAIDMINSKIGGGNWERSEIVKVTDNVSTLRFRVTNPAVDHLLFMCKQWITFGVTY